MGKLKHITIGLIVFWVSLTVSAQSVSVTDSLALVDLYNATNGPNWISNTNWLQPNIPARNWRGIYTRPDGSIWKIDLSQNNLTGSIPASFGNITDLEVINFWKNNLSGSIPSSIGQLTNLIELRLNENQLSGSLPTEIGQLTSLTYFRANTNQLSGTLPSSLGNLTNLETLILSSNQFTGTIPSQLGQLSNLTQLQLSSNGFTGTIPTSLGQLSSLVGLTLLNNQLTGNIPAELGNLSNLTTLGLDQNQLTGSFPTALLQLSNLATLTLSGNQLSGSLPSNFGDLSNLRVLSLEDNTFSGNIPTSLANITLLGSVRLSNNNFTGTIPSGLDQLTNSAFMIFEIDGNGLTFSNLETSHSNYVSGLGTYVYSPQANVDQEETPTITEGDNITLASTDLTSTNNSYQWYKDGQAIPGATSKDYVISNAASADAGVYYFQATNSVVTGLTLTRNNITLTVETDTCGVSAVEKQALLDLYNSTDGDNWTNTLANNQPWDPNIPVCDWYGVTVMNGKVQYIELDNNNLVGSIPSELENLTNLFGLFLPNNQLSGNIPSQLANISTILAISVENNQLSGNIPIEFANIPDPTMSLRVANNQLSGTIPDLTSYGELMIQSNNFHFSDFENEHVQYTGFSRNYIYSPQAKVDQEETPSVLEGGSITLTSTDLTSTNNSYQWYKDGVAIPGATGKDYVITNATSADAGVYYFEATNSVVTGLTLTRNDITLSVTADTCGVSATEKQALLDLYNSTDGDNWTNTLANNQPWDANIPVCDWFGVTVTNGNVTQLNLTNNNLSGFIPAQINNLTNLQGLYLSNNQISNNIPTELGQLTTLTHLSLNNNNFSGSIPTNLGQLQNLIYLGIEGNLLTGMIPAELGQLTNLEELRLTSNQLSGAIPVELGQISNLRILYLGSNQLTGSLPPQLGQLSNLINLNVSGNQLTGNIPSELSQLTSLQRLALNNNLLTGSIPHVLGQLSNLVNLYLSYNLLYGSIPSELGSIASLDRLQLRNNNLSGKIPSSISLLDLSVLRISENEFIFSDFETEHSVYTDFNEYLFSPQAKVDQEETLTVFDGNSITLTSTDLTSTNNSYQWYKDGQAIPSATSKDYVISNAASADAGVYYFEATNSVVTGLTLTRNDITLSVTADTCGVSAAEKQALLDLYNSTNGDNWTNTLANDQPWDPNIPVCDWFGVNVTNGSVTSLYLDSNQLSGSIPLGLGALTNLTSLNLSQNQLSGNIPTALGSLQNLEFLNLSVNELSGTIPLEFNNLTNLVSLYLNDNQLTGSLPDQIGNYVNVLDISSNSMEGTIPPIIVPTVVSFDNNFFHFEDFESEHPGYYNTYTYNYAPQGKVDQEETSSVLEAGTITLSSMDLTSANNSYQWYKDGVAIPGANSKDYVITNATSADAGVYYFEATNSVVTGLTLTRNNITLSVTTDTCGVSAAEKQALLDLYNSTDGDNWTNTLANNQPWDANIPVCDWYGITVSNGNVTKVELGTNNLVGSIPQSISDLSSLQNLFLNTNNITGTIPSSLGSLTNLTQLRLYNNQLSGSIPNELGLLSNLSLLYLYNNQLSGNLPSSLGNIITLRDLRINDNLLTGTIPSQYGQLVNLDLLYLYNNQLSGAIPEALSNMNAIRDLRLSANQLTGSIPSGFVQFSNLKTIDLSSNHLTGSIPNGFGQLSNLETVYLDSNQLTGPIPSDLGQATNLKDVLLYNNALSGTFSLELVHLENLVRLYIQNNNIIFSNIEDEFAQLVSKLGTSFIFSPQAKVDQEETLSILEYSSITLTSEVLTSTNNNYQWYKDGVAIPGATSKDYVITNATSADAGVYYFQATNSVVTGLTLTRNNITLSVESGSNTVVQQNFCTANGVPTVADLLIPTPTGVSPIWYTTETGGTPLDPSTVLQDRNTYWRDYSGNTNSRAAVKAIIDALLPIGNSTQSFDSATNPTLGDIVVALNPLSSASQIQWYATATSTDVLPSATLLVDGQSYYAAESVTACRLKIKVNVAPQEVCVEVVSEGTGGQSVVDGSFEGAANVLIPNNRNEAMGASGWGAVLGTPDTFGTPYSNPNDPYLQATFTASPNGGICAGALRYQDQAETFAANIDGLETSATYIVEFYTANITNVVNEAVSKEALGHWEVTFGGTTKLSGAITPNTTGATTWKRQRLEFTNIGGSLQLLQFKVGSSATDQNSAYPVYMLIDGIRVYVKPQNVHTTVCSTVDTQVFCDSDDDNPLTIADLASPTGESVTWYSTALGGRQYFSTYELSNISSDFIWADDGSGNPRIPVEILLDFGAPTGDNYQSFDIADNPTLADLVVEGTNITWHSSYTSTTVLPLSTPLVSNTVYYAAQDGNDCRSSVEVFVGIPMLTGEGNQVFCSSSEPKISDLVMETTNPSYTLAWYNAETDGVAYNSTDSLVDGQTYYATQTSGTGESEERYPVKVSIIDTAEENILYERDIEVASGTTLADLTTFFELDPGILWYDFPQSGTAYSSSYTVNDGETYYARISEGICDALEVLAVTVYIEDVVNPELVTCIKFIPQPGDRYVISGWVREHSATAVPTSTLEFTEQQTFIALLDHLTSKILNKEQVPPVYELQSDPQAPKVNALLPFIKNFTGTNVTVYNFQLETEQIGAQQVAVGYSFALAPDNLYRFVYRTPMVVYEFDVYDKPELEDYHYPILNYDNLEIEYTDVAIVGNKFRITSNFILSGTTDSPYKSEFNGHTSDSDTDSGIEDIVELYDYVEDPMYMVMDYLNTSIALYYEDVNGQEIVLGGSSVVFQPKGAIIDGWQRISGDFTIPSDAAYMRIILKNEGTGLNAYFDDVRMHPFDSNLKSFVYDPITQRLQAELDENNYATFYEYDTEGGLVRVKKETERGIYTIQETRSGNSKLNNGSE